MPYRMIAEKQHVESRSGQLFGLGICFLLWFASTHCNAPGPSSHKGGPADSLVSAYPAFPDAGAFRDTISGKPVQLFEIRNAAGMRAALTNYGARMVGLWVPDKKGSFTDVVLGFDSLSGYLRSTEPFFGAIVGRYGNRIAKGSFSLDGQVYRLDINNAPNCLHGGKDGFHTRVWDALQPDSQTLQFRYRARDGEGGFPGNLEVMVEYRLTDSNELRMSYTWSSDRKTVANITNHNFWNLNGVGPVANHFLRVYASEYTPVDATLIPTGIASVGGTPFDFQQGRRVGDSLSSPHTQLAFGSGYDHNYVLDREGRDSMRPAALVVGDLSGIRMEIWTTEPGLQFYGGNFMQSKNRMKGNIKDDYRTAFCLETQHFPDSPNRPDFPGTEVIPGRVYRSTTVHRFRLE